MHTLKRHSHRINAISRVPTSLPSGLSARPWGNSPEEEQALAELKKRMSAWPYTVDDATMKWFLRDRGLNPVAAEDKLLMMLRWRMEFGADRLQVTDVAAEAATGKAYLHSKPDILGRPVIIVRAAKHFTGVRSLKESEQLCVYLLDRAVEKLQHEDSPQETLLGIFDLRGFGHANADIGFVRFMVDVFFSYYPKRLSQVLFVEAPWVFKPGWEMVKPWLKKYAALVRFVSVDDVRHEYFKPETLPDDFAPKSFLTRSEN